MTVVEIRLTTPARLSEVLAVPSAAVGIGQEGCLDKLPSAGVLADAARRIRDSGRRPVLVAPIAWPRTIHELTTRLRAIAREGPVTITVNDLGTARALTAEPLPGTVLVAGQGLTRARPHSGDPDGQGPHRPVLDLSLLSVLAAWGITCAEVDTTITESDLGAAAAAGLELRQVADAVAVGFARSCPTARHHRTGPPGCQSLCDVPYHLRTEQRWKINHGHREPLPAGTSRPELTVWGNGVYQVAATGPSTDYRIVDARWHTPQSLATAVRTLSDEVPVHAG